MAGSASFGGRAQPCCPATGQTDPGRLHVGHQARPDIPVAPVSIAAIDRVPLPVLGRPPSSRIGRNKDSERIRCGATGYRSSGGRPREGTRVSWEDNRGLASTLPRCWRGSYAFRRCYDRPAFQSNRVRRKRTCGASDGSEVVRPSGQWTSNRARDAPSGTPKCRRAASPVRYPLLERTARVRRP